MGKIGVGLGQKMIESGWVFPVKDLRFGWGGSCPSVQEAKTWIRGGVQA